MQFCSTPEKFIREALMCLFRLLINRFVDTALNNWIKIRCFQHRICISFIKIYRLEVYLSKLFRKNKLKFQNSHVYILIQYDTILIDKEMKLFCLWNVTKSDVLDDVPYSRVYIYTWNFIISKLDTRDYICRNAY